MMTMYYLLPFRVNYVAVITLYRRNKRKRIHRYKPDIALSLSYSQRANVSFSPCFRSYFSDVCTKAMIWWLGFASSNVTWILVLILEQLSGFRSHKKEI